MKLIFITILLCSIALSPISCQEPVNTTTTTTTIPTTPTTTTAATTTTATTTSTTTTTTTTKAPPAELPILSFRLPLNDSEPAFLRLNSSFQFNILYSTKDAQNETANITLDTYTSYDGKRDATTNELRISFFTNWSLTFTYTLLKDSYYELSTIQLQYVLDKEHFPNAALPGTNGVAGILNQTLFSANKGNSYKCFATTNIALSDQVNLIVSNYQAQPFLTEKTQGFDTAIECAADTIGTSKLVPIIVGSALAILVVLVLVAYLIGRRKHRPGYQNV